ncbi:heparan-alpha-glucosaminide N-acetyltransferase domain-containing protein [Nocardioides sp.]|uniref:heparan-alpha-glucosaminide N-acetyltransferase domain-containing protein n=1 Tax=Nocardioides sp. TaxID=35761 RepID=UPI00352928BB
MPSSTRPAPAGDERAWSGGRIVGIDIARWWALMGMVATHVLVAVRPGGGGITTVQAVAGGRASALFAVLAGVSMALLSGGVRPVSGDARRGARRGLLVRAALIAGWGLILGQLGTSIAVILTYYGALFVLGLPFLGLRTRSLVPLALGWAVLAPLLSFWLRPHLPDRLDASPVLADLGHPALLAGQLLFTGVYPAFSWLAYLLLGLAIGRTSLDRRRVAVALVGWGTVAAVTSYAASRALLAAPGVRAELAATLPPGMNRGGLDLTLAWGMLGVTPTGSTWWLAVLTPHSGDAVRPGPHRWLRGRRDRAQPAGPPSWRPRPLSVLFGAGR